MKQGQKSVFKQHRLKKNQAGQAVVEYILLAVIIVGVILGMKNAFSAINDGMNRYIGDYVACLMEYGELPSLGVKEDDVKKHTAGTGKKCEEKFAEFTFEGGRPPIGGGSGTSSAGANNSANSGSGNTNSRSGSQSGNSSSSSSSSQSGVDGDSSDGNGLSNLRGNSRARRGDPNSKNQIGSTAETSYGTADGSSDLAQKRRIIEDPEEDAESRKRDRQSSKRRFYSRTDVIEYRALNGRMAEQIEKQEKKRPKPRQPTSRVIASSSKEELTLKSNRKVFTPKTYEKPTENSQSDEGFAFGNILRWLIIAGMVIAIVIFFGGQIMNYSNSQD